MKTTREKIEVMEAYDRGEIIQSMSTDESSYSDNPSPVWNWPSVDYRIKPKPKVKRWLWAYFNSAGVWGRTIQYFTDEEAERYFVSRDKAFKIESSMIEVDE